MKLKYFVFGVGMLAAVSAGAQTVDVPSIAGAPGDTISGTITFTAGAQDLASWQADISYDRPNTDIVTFPECPATMGPAAPGTIQCAQQAGGQFAVFRFGMFTIPSQVIGSGNVAVFEFTIPPGTPPGTFPMVVDDFAAFDLMGVNVTGSLTVTAGDITVSAPAGSGFYGSSPAPGGNLDLGAAVVNSAATPVDNLTVQNLSPDTDFDVTAITSMGPVAFAPVVPFTVAFGGSTVVTATCTPTARGANGGSFSVTHDSAAGAPSPVDYTFDCAGLSPNVQVPAGPINLAALTVDPAPTGNINVTNPQDGFTSAAANVTAAAGAGDAQITVTTAGPTTINPDASFNFVVSCDNTAAGNFSRTINITWNNPLVSGPNSDSIVVNCAVTDAIPSFTSTPAAPGPLAFGTVTNGTTSAPIGINVGNDGVGPAPDSNLNITSVVSSNPQLVATLINGGPFPVGTPAGADDIEVTCSPTSVGAIAGTITVNHNGDDNPTVFNATCTGESDAAFSSTPAPGGTLNLGVVSPGSTTPEGFIDFSNGGSANSLQVDCTVTDPDGVFTFTPDPISFAIAPGATESVGFQCTPLTPDSFSAAVSCAITGAAAPIQADYTVVCQGQPLVVPTMNRWGLVIMSLMLLLVAGFAGRRMMA